ncbi:MAG: hypothetical protein WCE44_14665 [Candidatus Velthaea sp.]
MASSQRSAIRLYASLSEPQPVLWMDRRIVVLVAGLIVCGVVLICFQGRVGFAPSAACFLGAFGLGRFGKRLWAHNPYFLDEFAQHVVTPIVGGADERNR